MAAMTDDRGFLERWSKRKQAAREAAALPEPEPTAGPVAPIEPGPEPEPEPEIDPASLPPIGSIATGADLQAFLQKGVPKALKQAAMRRLWSADPAIREFREVADYDWDFNAPGYGALLPHDDPKALAEKLVAAMRRARGVTEQPEPASGNEPALAETRLAQPEPVEPDATRPTAAPLRRDAPLLSTEPAAAAPPEAQPPRRRRRHGAATPS